MAEVDGERLHAGTVADLLERWFVAASLGWAATTVAHTRSIPPGQVAALLEAVRGDRPLLFCLLRLDATTGSRRSQLLANR